MNEKKLAGTTVLKFIPMALWPVIIQEIKEVEEAEDDTQTGENASPSTRQMDADIRAWAEKRIKEQQKIKHP